MNILGIDEAGRGCVIGPLVVAGVLISEGQLKVLRQLGVRDSKTLTRTRRAVLYGQIERVIKESFTVEIPPGALEENLTQVELKAMAQIISGSTADQVYLDLPVWSGAGKGFVRTLRSALGYRELDLIAENRADETYPVVSAASIIAKVTRDRAIERLHKQYGDFGWGYPSEQKTRAFLSEYYTRHRRFPECARAKWQTLRNLKELRLSL
jgi:ribonuclease HII